MFDEYDRFGLRVHTTQLMHRFDATKDAAEHALVSLWSTGCIRNGSVVENCGTFGMFTM